MDWFDLNKKESTREYLARIKYEKIVAKKAESFLDIVGDELVENVQYRFVTDNSFNAITVIEYLLKSNEIEEIYIAIYRMNYQSVLKIKEIVESGIRCNIVISSFFRENKKYEKWANELIQFSSSNDNINISFAWNHAKVFLAKTKDNKFVVFEGSGNLSDNARIEQYLIENNKNTYNFHKQWIDDILNAKEIKGKNFKNDFNYKSNEF
jgi:hypothetical protein